jgi:hypothetical protein
VRRESDGSRRSPILSFRYSAIAVSRPNPRPQYLRVTGLLPVLALATTLATSVGCGRPIQREAIGASATADSRTRGVVAGTLIDPPASDRYVAEEGVRYEQPTAYFENAHPEYPAALLSTHLPSFKVRIRVVVDETGHVTQIRRLEEDDSPGNVAAFESTRAAVTGWRYLPLVRISPGPGSTTLEYDPGLFSRYEGVAVALPFHQDYEFEYSQVDGKGSVSIK